jgi:hypothetical protein
LDLSNNNLDSFLKNIGGPEKEWTAVSEKPWSGVRVYPHTMPLTLKKWSCLKPKTHVFIWGGDMAQWEREGMGFYNKIKSDR